MRVIIEIWAASDVFLRELELPYLPTVGMGMRLGFAGEFEDLEVVGVCYDEETNEMQVSCDFLDKETLAGKFSCLDIHRRVQRDGNWTFRGDAPGRTIQDAIREIEEE